MTRILLTISVFLLISIWVFVGWKYAGLPEIIPTHFDMNGHMDGQDHKKIIWFLPSIATFLFFILFAVTRDIHSPMLNIPDNFRNKESVELFSYSILLSLLLLLGYTILKTVSMAEGKTNTLGNLFFVFLGLLFAVIGTNILIMFKKGKNG
ncbi:DUF1648 domain-containing protein [Chryseobacterium populi]|uniref:DUF1648 domain-containing protein n=1 Tax=Chryseobacterium populi TaxID=1144316 RepID=J2JW96_9FLAO|nr:DUF1648 domain-containing protein [Chryseobacterium populi]EJL72115.1 Protein of unknown function (DUF1648) [Chryseobacterium populi]